MQLLKNAKLSSAITPTAGAAATTDIEGSIIDMSGFEGVAAIVRMGAITANAVTSLKMRQSDNSDMSSPGDVTGTAQTIADDDDEEIFYVELFRPAKRYVQLYIDRGTQNAVVSSAVYLQYGPRVAPVSHGATVSGESHISPASGTA
jgi:hypothetical protein